MDKIKTERTIYYKVDLENDICQTCLSKTNKDSFLAYFYRINEYEYLVKVRCCKMCWKKYSMHDHIIKAFGISDELEYKYIIVSVFVELKKFIKTKTSGLAFECVKK